MSTLQQQPAIPHKVFVLGARPLMAERSRHHIKLRGGVAIRLSVLVLVLVLVWRDFAYAADGPVPPCAMEGPSINPPFADPPNAGNWHPRDLAGWAPPACIAWASQRFTVLTVLSAIFRFAGNVDDLLAGFGALSAWKGIQYWSVTDGRWDTLITDSFAIDDPSRRQRRPDFTPAELKSGADFYFLQQDNRTSRAVVYRMKVEAAGPNRLVVTVENVSAVSMFLFTLFGSGDLKSTYIFETLSPGIWGYYSLSGTREGAAVIGNYDASYLNRALAIYRHLVGIPTNQEPPLAR
jgi:hypothetical protein